jgi:hypothetical protein
MCKDNPLHPARHSAWHWHRRPVAIVQKPQSVNAHKLFADNLILGQFFKMSSKFKALL